MTYETLHLLLLKLYSLQIHIKRRVCSFIWKDIFEGNVKYNMKYENYYLKQAA